MVSIMSYVYDIVLYIYTTYIYTCIIIYIHAVAAGGVHVQGGPVCGGQPD